VKPWVVVDECKGGVEDEGALSDEEEELQATRLARGNRLMIPAR
jgi:hypothetical protein